MNTAVGEEFQHFELAIIFNGLRRVQRGYVALRTLRRRNADSEGREQRNTCALNPVFE